MNRRAEPVSIFLQNAHKSAEIEGQLHGHSAGRNIHGRAVVEGKGVEEWGWDFLQKVRLINFGRYFYRGRPYFKLKSI